MTMTTPFRTSLAIAAALTVIAVAGCSQGGKTTASAAPASAQSGQAARDLETYRQMLAMENDKAAVAVGRDIVQRFPDSDAAREVQKTLPAIEKRWDANSESVRLSGLWEYQVAPMAGGTQSTAVIYNSDPVDAHVRLALRRHTSWGQSVFIYNDAGPFVCKGDCTIAARFDGKAHPIKAYAPPTGEPALMIRDDKGFIALLKKARKIELPITFRDAGKKATLVYEVGGFVADKWAPLPKGDGKK